MKRLLFIAAIASSVLSVVGIWLAEGSRGVLASAPSLSEERAVGANGRSPQEGPDVGQLAPDFALTDLRGEALKLSDLRGRYVLLNFWASTCPYCRREMPILQKISEENPELAVIGINVLETKDAIETFLWDVGVNYQVLQDAWGEVFVNYRVTKIPATFLIDERGVIVWKKFGSVSEKELENQLKGFSQRR